MRPLDCLVFGTVAIVAVALGALHICPFDWAWAAATLLVVALWAAIVHHRPRNHDRDRDRIR